MSSDAGLPGEVDLDDYGFTIGGTGGTGGNGGSVTAANSGAITTGAGAPGIGSGTAYQGHGVVLQSVGGGGGFGAMGALSNSLTYADVAPGFTIGGGGGRRLPRL